VARRIFGAATKAAAAPQRATTWNWLAPMAACALTLLVAVHTGSRASLPLASQNSSASFFTVMLDAATSSNLASYSLSEMDENLEWNVWPHASHHLQFPQPAEFHPRHDVFNILNIIPTNR
jgi:hypothetical protein